MIELKIKRQEGTCPGGLLPQISDEFLRPYKGGLILGLLMVVVANITFAVMPVVEGEMTTQLFR